MDTTERTIWQFAAGGGGRNYSDLLIDWDVIALGPGRFGPWPECHEAMQQAGVRSEKCTEIQAFYEDIGVRDLVVLRRGTRKIYAVGEVVSGAKHEPVFGDIDGWDLQHVRRVRWLWSYEEKPASFDAYTLNWGGTLHGGVKPEVEHWIESLSSNGTPDRPLHPLPKDSGNQISVHDIGRYLFDSGVAAGSINDLLDEIDELNRIARWYGRSRVDPSEHETVAYLVIPLLRALGWTPQKMALEWGHIDIALFEKLPREAGHLIAAVEAKKWGNSCLSARSQAERYANKLANHSCKRLVVTDGNRYGVFVRDRNGFPRRPNAYLNLARLRDRYPVMESDGAQEALRLMSAGWN